MKLTIPGDPIAQMRPRFRRVGAHVMTYDPQKPQKEAIRSLIFENAFKPIENRAISLNVTFFVPIPNSATEAKRNAFLWKLELPIHKPDLDNYIKFLDFANGILWHDDCQITTINAKKQYSDNPRTEIEIMEVYMPKHITDILRNISPGEAHELLHSCTILATFENVSEENLHEMATHLHAFATKHAKTLSKIAKVPCDKP
jgi:Holliday junction resolvase RusA-like endonuclease